MILCAAALVMLYLAGWVVALAMNIAPAVRAYRANIGQNLIKANMPAWAVTLIFYILCPAVALSAMPQHLRYQLRLGCRIGRMQRHVARGGLAPGSVMTNGVLTGLCFQLATKSVRWVDVGDAKFCALTSEGAVCSCGTPAVAALGVDSLCPSHLYDALLQYTRRLPYVESRLAGWVWPEVPVPPPSALPPLA